MKSAHSLAIREPFTVETLCRISSGGSFVVSRTNTHCPQCQLRLAWLTAVGCPTEGTADYGAFKVESVLLWRMIEVLDP